MLFADMGQKYHIIPLALAHRTHPPSTEPTRCDLQRRLPPFLALPSPHAVGGLLCEAACSPFRRLHAVLTSDRHADVAEPICSASKAQPLNPMKVKAALGHCSSPCAPHHAETRLCISLPFSISFIANIARKRPELNRDKSKCKTCAKFTGLALQSM